MTGCTTVHIPFPKLDLCIDDLLQGCQTQGKDCDLEAAGHSATSGKKMWNGWVTDRRMASLRREQGQSLRGCMLGRGWDEDAWNIAHAAGCTGNL